MRDAIPVSILYSTTGAYAALGREAVAGALAAVSEVNLNGDLPFRFEPKVDDPGGRAEHYALLAEAAIRDGGCRHVIGTITSWSRKDVLPVVERRGALLWYAFPYEGYEASDSILYLGACPNQHLLPLLDHVVPRHGNRPFVVGSNYIWGWEISRIARELIEAGGGEVVSERFVPLGSTQVDHLIQEIDRRKPDFILSNLVGESSAAFLAAYGAYRTAHALASPVVSCNLTETDLEGLAPAARAGHVSTAQYFHRLDTAENRAFTARMAARHGVERRLTGAFVAAYTSVSVLAQAIADAGTDTPAAIAKVATARLFETPCGALAIDPRNHHAALTPLLALSDTGGDFDIFARADEPVRADPYLVQSLSRPPAPPAPGSFLGTLLKVVT